MQAGDFIRERDLAAAVNRSMRTMRAHRHTGDCPPYTRFGREIMYARATAEPWLATRTYKSKSDEDARRRAIAAGGADDRP